MKKIILSFTSLCSLMLVDTAFAYHNSIHEAEYQDPSIEIHLDALDNSREHRYRGKRKGPIATHKQGPYSETIDLLDDKKNIKKKKTKSSQSIISDQPLKPINKDQNIIPQKIKKKITAPKEPIQDIKPAEPITPREPIAPTPVTPIIPKKSVDDNISVLPKLENKNIQTEPKAKMDNRIIDSIEMMPLPENTKSKTDFLPKDNISKPAIKNIAPIITPITPPVTPTTPALPSLQEMPVTKKDKNILDKVTSNKVPMSKADIVEPEIEENITKLPDVPNIDDFFKEEDKNNQEINNIPADNQGTTKSFIDEIATPEQLPEIENHSESNKMPDFELPAIDQQPNLPVLPVMPDENLEAPQEIQREEVAPSAKKSINTKSEDQGSLWDWVPFFGNKKVKKNIPSDENNNVNKIPVINTEDSDNDNDSLVPKPNLSIAPPISIEKTTGDKSDDSTHDTVPETFSPNIPKLPDNVESPYLPKVKDDLIEKTHESSKSLIDLLPFGNNNKTTDKNTAPTKEDQSININNKDIVNSPDLVENVPSLDNEEDTEDMVNDLLKNLPPLPEVDNQKIDNSTIKPSEPVEEKSSIPDNTINLKPVPPSKEKFNIEEDNINNEEKLDVLTVPNKLNETPLSAIKPTPNYNSFANDTTIAELKKDSSEIKKSNKLEITVQNNGSIISHIEYKTGGIDLKNKFDYEDQINKAITFFKEHPTYRIKVISYAKSVVDQPNSARRISLDRALEIRKKLISLNIDSIRINVQAMGENMSNPDSDYVEIIMIGEN